MRRSLLSFLAFVVFSACAAAAQGIASLPEAPSALLADASRAVPPDTGASARHLEVPAASSSSTSLFAEGAAGPLQQGEPAKRRANGEAPELDANGNPIPVSRTQPKRILGLMPNYRTVSGGAVAQRPSLRRNFSIATKQAFDYSSFVFLGITSGAAYWQGSHPSLDTYNGGNAVFWGYLWRGFLDKTDGTYQSAFLLPTLLHEDGRYYAMGTGSKWRRLGYSASRVAITRTYSGSQTVNLAGLGGKVGAQAVSRLYYPPGASDFSVLATKFAYAVARDMGFTVFREFYPDIATHVLHRHP